jgi:hypothetical protein
MSAGAFLSTNDNRDTNIKLPINTNPGDFLLKKLISPSELTEMGRSNGDPIVL